MKYKILGVIGATAVTVLALTSCSGPGGGGGSDADGTLDYWLWDANQLLAYEQCADDFHAENPDLKVKITQLGYGDYWGKLTNGMAAGNAPEVFTNHLSKYPDFLKTKQLLALDDLDVDLSIYNDGLADLWVGEDGKRYGLPKDWDTVALFYNKGMTEEAGISDEQMSTLTWNPDDGGTYEEVIAHLTVDKNGKRGDEAGFDKDNVEVYGLGLGGAGAGMGQTEWSYLAATTGWTHTDKNPWGTHYNYDSADFQDTIAWWTGLIDKGYMPRLETTVGAAMNDNFGASKFAINSNGSWMIGSYAGYEGVDLGIAPTPVGPNGKSASMYNGLADSIWVGAKDKAGAEKWVTYLASEACQDTVGELGVVFPATVSGTEKATEAFEAKGIDVTAFTSHVTDGTTFLFPITDNAAKIDGIMQPAMDAVLQGSADVSSLTDANDQVNALFQ